MGEFLKQPKTIAFVLGLIFALVLVWLLSVFLIGLAFNFSPQTPLERLETTRATWEASGVESYRMTVQMFVPLVAVGRFTVTVRQGEVVDSTPTPLEGQALASFDFIMPREAQEYTVERVFDLAASLVTDIPAPPLITTCGKDGNPYDLTYQPDLGYITSFTIGECGGAGLLCGIATDCPSGFRVVEFEILTE